VADVRKGTDLLGFNALPGIKSGKPALEDALIEGHLSFPFS
jgi:hypothetical protein